MAAPLQSTRGAIRTRYNGILFRSKLEADWARCFDRLGVVWEYEKEARYFGPVFYYPDFLLPRSRQYVEVKGDWQPADCRKVGALLRHLEPRPHTSLDCPDVPLIAANPAGAWWGYRRPRPDEDAEDMGTLLMELNTPVELLRCLLCGGWWFCVPDASWACQCCGASEGNAYVAHRLTSPLVGWPVEVEVW